MVRRATGKGNTPARGKGKGAAGKPRKITERVLRTAAGPRVTVEFQRGLDDALVVAALKEALGLAEARSATEGHAAAEGKAVRCFPLRPAPPKRRGGPGTSHPTKSLIATRPAFTTAVGRLFQAWGPSALGVRPGG